MGFPAIIALAASAVGTGVQVSAAQTAAAQQKAAAAKAISDTKSALSDQENQKKSSLQLGRAFSQLSAYQAQSAGNSGLMFSNKLGKPGGSAA